jgi:prolipoprotein diacylglyceryltransferase
LLADWLRIPPAVYWDHMIWGIVAGAVFVRFGCICNGCCGGKPTDRWYGVCQHDARGARRRRIPVQWLEIGWWLMAAIGLLWLWPYAMPAGSYAAGGLAWYGLGRFWLEPLREQSDVVAGLRINQVVAATLALVSAAVLLWRL